MGRTVAREDVGAMKVIETPVLIVGGAGCGLSSSIMLAQHGIESWLVERYPTPPPAPKAHHPNQRQQKSLRETGISDPIYPVRTPTKNMYPLGWLTPPDAEGGRTP